MQSTTSGQPHSLALQSCQKDDISLICQAISPASSAGRSSGTPFKEILSQAVTESIRHNATKVLDYVLENGGNVPAYSDLHVENPSTHARDLIRTWVGYQRPMSYWR